MQLSLIDLQGGRQENRYPNLTLLHSGLLLVLPYWPNSTGSQKAKKSLEVDEKKKNQHSWATGKGRIWARVANGESPTSVKSHWRDSSRGLM